MCISRYLHTPLVTSVGSVAMLLIIGSCSSLDPWQEPDNYVINLDGRLSQTGDGIYRLRLRRDRFQTVHRISGRMLDTDSNPPYQPQRITFASSHTWALQQGDTVITIYRRTIDASGNWVVLDSSTIIAPSDLLVPTVNGVSYTDTRGEFSTMIGPVLSMLGDTITIQAKWTSSWYQTDTIRSSLRVVLE